MVIDGIINKAQRLSRKRVQSSDWKCTTPYKEGEDIVLPYMKI